MAKMYEHLDAWKEATNLAVKVYEITKEFPSTEFYGITSQLRRASVSISSNIAEGAGRSSKKDFKQFVHIASGSLNEVESLLHISFQLGFLQDGEFSDMRERVRQVGRLVGGLLRYLNENK